MLTIAHSYDAGTTVDGTAKGDGSAPVLKRHGLRWSRNIGSAGAWFVPRSRDREARGVEQLADALRAAGFEVTTEVDDTRTSIAEREERREQRREERQLGLFAKSERLAGAAEAQREQVDRIAGAIPFGQPILVGHHSERRHRRDLERIDRGMSRMVETHRASEAAAGRAQAAAHERERRRDPVFIGNRIEDAQREIRAAERELAAARSAGSAASYVARKERRLAEAREKLAYWTEQREQSGAKLYTKDDVAKGDAVLVRGHWSIVARSNRKTVAILCGMPWPLNYGWHEVKGHREGTDETRAALAEHEAERKRTRAALAR